MWLYILLLSVIHLEGAQTGTHSTNWKVCGCPRMTLRPPSDDRVDITQTHISLDFDNQNASLWAVGHSNDYIPL